MARLSNVYGDKHDDHLHRKGTGVPQPFNNPLAGNLSPLEAGLALHARYVCIDALGNPLYSIFDRPVPWSDYWNTVSIKNGQTFTMSASPTARRNQ